MTANRRMRMLFLGRKPGAAAALQYLVQERVEVAAVVAPEHPRAGDGQPHLDAVARELGLSVLSPSGLDEILSKNPKSLGPIDLAVSYLYWLRIKPPLLTLPRLGVINLHPAPLPEYRGLGGYNFAILAGDAQFGVSAHFVAETIDTGDVIEVRRFPIDAERETAQSLERKSQRHLLALFRDVIDRLLRDGCLPRAPQGPGRYYTRQEMEDAKRVLPEDPAELVERKIRAFWYPPYEGAYLEREGRRYTLVSEAILRGLAGE
ncbi:formyl transferase [bacterium]|nr:formyl transferase [bacterium]